MSGTSSSKNTGLKTPKHGGASEKEGIKVLVDGIDVLPIKLGSRYLARSG